MKYLLIDPQTKQVTVMCRDRLCLIRTLQLSPGISIEPHVLQILLVMYRGSLVLVFCAIFLALNMCLLATSGLLLFISI